MQASHAARSAAWSFDDPNLVSAAGLLPIVGLAEKAGLRGLADQGLSVPTDKGANAGLKVSSLVAGMVAGADSIDDMAVLRHGGMGKIFTSIYAPSTFGVVPTLVHVRARPSARRRRVPVADSPRR